MPTPIKLSRSHISIHAPTRGATSSVVCLNSSMRNFNPRSHERSDSSRRSNHKCKANFNPRSHERSDDILMGCNLCFSIISIHAPTRGATYQQVHFTVAYIIFQSTLPREERQQYCTKNLFIFIQYRQ